MSGLSVMRENCRYIQTDKTFTSQCECESIANVCGKYSVFTIETARNLSDFVFVATVLTTSAKGMAIETQNAHICTIQWPFHVATNTTTKHGVENSIHSCV